MKKAKTTTATASVSSAPATASFDDDLALLWEAQVAEPEAPPASEERPSLHLVEPAPEAASEPVSAPSVAPLAHTCPECGAQVADLPGVWDSERGLCKVCAQAEDCTCACGREKYPNKPMCKVCFTAACVCRCGKTKHAQKPLCPECHKALLKQRAEEQEAMRLTCPKCNGPKERYHRVCPSCYAATLPQRPAGKESSRPEAKVDPRVQAKTSARDKLAQDLLTAHRAGTLDKSFPGAKVTKDEAMNCMVSIAFKGDSFTIKDQAKAKDIAELKAMQAKAEAAARAEAARVAAEKRRQEAAARKAAKSEKPKKGKKDKAGEAGAKPTKAERKAARKGK